MRRGLVLLLVMVVGIVALLLGDAYYRAEVAEDNQVVLIGAANNAADSLEDALARRVRVVRDLHAFMLAPPTLPEAAIFDRYAAGVLASADLRALQYVSPDLTISYVYPFTGNEAALGLDLTTRPAAPYVYAAIEEGRMTISDPAPLVQGPVGTVIRLPLFRDGQLLGLVQGVVDVEPLLAEVVGELGDDFTVQIGDSEGTLFWGSAEVEGVAREIHTGAGDQTWTMVVGWADGAPGPDPILGALLWGLGLAFLFILLLFIYRTLLRTDWLTAAVSARTAELAASERKYRAVVEQATDGILITDKAGNYLDANPAALSMLGYSRQKLLTLNAQDIVSPDEQAHAPLRFGQLEKEGHLLSERWLRRSDGALVLVEVSAGKLPDGRYLGIMRDVTDRREAEETLYRREAILEAVSFSAEHFLRSSDWRRQIAQVLARLGEAAQASRSYIFQNREGAEGRLLARYLYEWTASGVEAQIDMPALQHFSYAEEGAQDWRERLSRGESVSGPVAGLSPGMRALLSSLEILSVAIVPIFTGEEWWGFMGFDDCEQARHWSPAEVGALQAAADTLGAAIVRERNERRIRQSAERAEALVRTAARLNDRLEREAVLEIICAEAQRVLDAPVAVITLYDADSDSFKIVTGLGLPLALKEDIRQLPYALYKQYAPEEMDLPLLLEDIQALPDLPHAAVYAAHELRTVLFARLVHEGRIIGGLLVATFGQVRSFSREEQKLLGGLADQAAQALTNASLFSQTRRLLQQTRAQAQQVRQIIDTVPEGIILLDVRRRIVLANPAGREYLALMTDAQVGEVLERVDGKRLEEIVHQDTEAAWQEVQPRGSGRTFELAERPIGGEEGTTAGWVLAIREVTAERQRQQYLQRQERLATVGQLAAGIAHDFNNIMAIITLYSQTLERHPEMPQRDEYLRTISTQARHAADLIGQILDFSRRAVMEQGALDLVPFVKEIVKLLQRTLPETIEVTVALGDDSYVVYADPTRLQQVLMNLAVNARDAMPEGGELQLRLRAFMLAPGGRPPLPDMAPGRWVRLDVTDTGSGIEPDNLSRIFEPFFTTKERGEGTGLGLAQVYGIVKQHGGEIDVASVPGAGTTFTIYLPAWKSERQAREQQEARQAASPGGETILLVEDNEPTRAAICDTLEILGYRILVAGSGHQAMAVFAEHQEEIDLVLSDIVMPGMGGVQLYRQLLELEPEIKMMVMTGYPLEDEGRSLLEEGIVTWIRKPFSQREIRNRIRQVLAE